MKTHEHFTQLNKCVNANVNIIFRTNFICSQWNCFRLANTCSCLWRYFRCIECCTAIFFCSSIRIFFGFVLKRFASLFRFCVYPTVMARSPEDSISIKHVREGKKTFPTEKSTHKIDALAKMMEPGCLNEMWEKKIRANFPNNTWNTMLLYVINVLSFYFIYTVVACLLSHLCNVFASNLYNWENNNSMGNEFLIEKMSNIPCFFSLFACQRWALLSKWQSKMVARFGSIRKAMLCYAACH